MSSFRNIDTRLLDFQQGRFLYLQITAPHDQVGFALRLKGWWDMITREMIIICYISQSHKKTIISKDSVKIFVTINILLVFFFFSLKSTQTYKEIRFRRFSRQSEKGICPKSTANITLDGKTLKAISLKKQTNKQKKTKKTMTYRDSTTCVRYLLYYLTLFFK